MLFDYGIASANDLSINSFERTKTGKAKLSRIEIDGREVRPSRRFWRSFFSRFGIAENVFRYFEPHEVFQRISERNRDDNFRYCVHDDEQHVPTLLAVTSPSRPVIRYGEANDLVSRYGASEVTYHEGVVTSTHQPGTGNRLSQIGADEFQDRFILETPIDGFGAPRLYLSLMRLICSNGAIGYSRAFRSDISAGKHLDHCIIRALESYDNGDGYAALHQRFQSAQTSWASVKECLTLYHAMEKLTESHSLSQHGLFAQLRQTTGNLEEIYGLANLEALSDKRRRVLPARCRVYDLINFASEVATHHANEEGASRMQAYIGSLISDEYDLEGTAEKVTDFDAFFVAPKQTAADALRN